MYEEIYICEEIYATRQYIFICEYGRPDRGKPWSHDKSGTYYALAGEASVVGPRFIVGSILAVARLRAKKCITLIRTLLVDNILLI